MFAAACWRACREPTRPNDSTTGRNLRRGAGGPYHIAAWIAAEVNLDTALRFVEEVERACETLDLGAERGTERPDLRPGLRAIGFRRRVTIVFRVTEKRVDVLRISYGGRDWEREFD